jgi:GntR family transcriptional regulator
LNLMRLRSRTTYINDRPNQLADSSHIREELTTGMPVGPETVLLRLPEGMPVVELVRMTYDSGGRASEVMISVIAGDMASFCYDFPILD